MCGRLELSCGTLLQSKQYELRKNKLQWLIFMLLCLRCQLLAAKAKQHEYRPLHISLLRYHFCWIVLKDIFSMEINDMV